MIETLSRRRFLRTAAAGTSATLLPMPATAHGVGRDSPVLAYSHDEVASLVPDHPDLPAAVVAMGGIAAWNARPARFSDFWAAGVPGRFLSSLTWALSENRADVARRYRLWGADCAAHVLHYFERQHPGIMCVRDAIADSRSCARGEIANTDASRRAIAEILPETNLFGGRFSAIAAFYAAQNKCASAARAAVKAVNYWPIGRTDVAGQAGGDAEIAWQFDRLVARMSEPEPQDWPLG